jgi:hypothetical protein
MTTQHDNAKRWRPRFSVRTLVIVVTLVCCYFGCWEITKRYGVPDWEITGPLGTGPDRTYAYSPAPLVVVDIEDVTLPYMIRNGYGAWSGPPMMRTSYDLWLFGRRIRVFSTGDD